MYKKVFAWAIPVAIITVLSFIVIYKAITVPATFDEVTTWHNYTGFNKIVDIIFNAGGNSNNHILNSLAITVSQSVLPTNLLSLRLPNVISFFLFSAGIILLAKRFFNGSPLLLCLPFAFLFLNPYLIDFFSLARGYGMANAFVVCSIVCLLLFSSSKIIKWYYLAILFATLATYASFIFLMYWVAVHVLLIANLMLQHLEGRVKKRVLMITLLWALAFAVVCFAPVAGIQSCIASGFHITKNFYRNTFLTCIDRFLYGKELFGWPEKYIISRLVIAVLIIGSINSFLKIRKNPSSAFTDPFNQVFLLLLLVWLINIAQAYLSSTDYLSGRTTLIYYVLFIFVLIFLLRDMFAANVFGIQILTAIACLCFIVHFALAANLKSFYEWSYDAYTCDVMDKIKEYKQEHPEVKTIELNMTNSFRNSFDFYVSTHPLSWFKIPDPKDAALLNDKADTASQTLFYYSADRDAAGLKNYMVVKKYIATGLLVPLPDARPEQILLIHK